MTPTTHEKSPIGFVVAAVVVFVASFLTWAKISGPSLGGQPFPFPFPGMQLSISVTAWNGNLHLMGIELPNWLVVVSAAGIAAMRWWKQTGAWDVADSWPLGLAIYALIHAGWVLLAAASGGSVGIGLLLTTAALGWMLVALVRQMGTVTRTQPAQQEFEPFSLQEK